MDIVEQRKYLKRNIESLTPSQLVLVSKYVERLQSTSTQGKSVRENKTEDSLSALIKTIKQTELNSKNIIPPTQVYRHNPDEMDDEQPTDEVSFSEWDLSWDQLEKQLKEESLSHETQEREHDW